jgi:hypothetical protein
MRIYSPQKAQRKEKAKRGKAPASENGRYTHRKKQIPRFARDDNSRVARGAVLGAGVELEWGPVERLFEDDFGILIVEKG